jgi:hypothetical protein
MGRLELGKRRGRASCEDPLEGAQRSNCTRAEGVNWVEYLIDSGIWTLKVFN